MYKGIGDASYNDGLFSQAAPYQAYQASVSQFGDGGLGATSRLVSSRAFRPQRRHSSGSPRHAAAAGMGRTFLPAFGPRSMQGLGNVYNSGVLGDDATPAPSVLTMTPAQQYAAASVTPAMQTDIIALNSRADGLKQVSVQLGLGLGALALAVGYLYYKR